QPLPRGNRLVWLPGNQAATQKARNPCLQLSFSGGSLSPQRTLSADCKQKQQEDSCRFKGYSGAANAVISEPHFLFMPRKQPDCFVSGVAGQSRNAREPH